MKYEVTYRLMHPQSLPATSVTMVDAHTHRELDTRLGKVLAKWQSRGYTVWVVRVAPKQATKIDIGYECDKPLM